MASTSPSPRTGSQGGRLVVVVGGPPDGVVGMEEGLLDLLPARLPILSA